MKKMLLIIFLGCLTIVQCFAGIIQELNGKLYLSPGSVYVASKAIYVNINDQFISIKGIASDTDGIYILPDSETGIFGDTWICPNKNCGYENYTAISKCALCGTARP